MGKLEHYYNSVTKRGQVPDKNNKEYMQQWNKIFKESGKYFIKPQEDMSKIVKLFKKNGVKKVLDLGCGSGRHTIYLAKKGFDVYGFDIAEDGIKIAKDWLKKENQKANFKIGSIYRKLPYRDSFFDAVISTQTLHHGTIGDIRKLIKEISRILKSKGLIFATVTKQRPKKEIPKEMLWRIKIIAPRTFIPLDGDEKGLIHYRFNEEILRKEFKNFKIYDIWVESTKKHYVFLGELKIK